MDKTDFTSDKRYKEHLMEASDDFYSKYSRDVERLLGNDGTFLDIGCGTGNVLSILSRSVSVKNLYGIDISDYFISDIKEDFQVKTFDGEKIPFDDGYFDVVGSFTVLEHVKEPQSFLEEQLRVLKSDGYIVTACPNFLSIFNHVRGYSLQEKMVKQIQLFRTREFEKNEPIVRETFMSDDDAIVVTNLAPLVYFYRKRGLRIVRVEGTMGIDGSIITRVLKSMPLVRLLLPSCYVIARKV